MTQTRDSKFFPRFIKWIKLDVSPHFRKNKEGQFLFYPWGYPGESIVIDQKQKNKIEFFMYFGALAFVLWCVLAIFLEELNVISRPIGNYLFLISSVGIVPAYAFSMHKIAKEKEFLVLPKGDRPAKWNYLWVLLIACCQAWGLYDYAHQMPMAFLILCCLGFFYTLYLFVKVSLTRGYYFSS